MYIVFTSLTGQTLGTVYPSPGERVTPPSCPSSLGGPGPKPGPGPGPRPIPL